MNVKRLLAVASLALSTTAAADTPRLLKNGRPACGNVPKKGRMDDCEREAQGSTANSSTPSSPLQGNGRVKKPNKLAAGSFAQSLPTQLISYVKKPR
jgi:hypothetical protein